MIEGGGSRAAENPYDEVPYPTSANPDTLPSNMAVLAHLRGLPFRPFAQSRVLEVGCGDASNLLSLAVMAPEAEFVGIDLAPLPIARGQAMAAAAGISNVMLKVGDVFDPQVVGGTFDYIIAHGLYAWVPPAVQEALIALYGRALAPDGLGFVSYNVLPGCSIRYALRTVLQDGTAGLQTRQEKAAATQQVLEYFADAWEKRGPLEQALAEEAREKLKHSAEYLFHDELAEYYEPSLLSDFVARVRRHGMAYMADAQAHLNTDAFFPELGIDTLRHRAEGDWVRYEQLHDFVVQRRFRESLILRSDGSPVPHHIEWTCVRDLYAEGRFTPAEPQKEGYFAFRTPKDEPIETDEADLAALIGQIAAVYPASLPLADRIDNPAMARAIVRLYVAGAIRLSTAPVVFATTAGERPLASPLARVQAARGDSYLATLRHMMVGKLEPSALYLVTLLDGTRGHAELAEAMSRHLGAPVAETQARLPAVLAEVARSSLLLEEERRLS